MSTSETPERSWPDCGEVQCKQVHDFMDTLLETLGVDTDKNTLAIGKGIQIATSVNELKAELTAAKAEVEKLKQINDTQARELIERGKDIDTLKTAMHQSPTKLCHIDRDRAEQQRCKRCEAYLSDKRPAGRTLCEDCMRLPEHTYIPPVIIPPAKPHDIGWPLPAPPWENISTTPLRDQNTP